MKRRALEHRDTLCIGRSHGVHAEPTSFGHKLAVFAFQLDRDRERLRRAREAVRVGAISGAVGSYATVDPRVEERVCARLGLRPAEASTQVIQRDRHAEFLRGAGASCASTLDALATEIRHLARTEVREVQEPFAEGQKGSSAMPHKRNPVVSRAGLRPGARDPRARAGGARERGALARARHLALLGGARDPAGRHRAAGVHAPRHDVGDGRAGRLPGADARATRWRTGRSPSASRCCSPSSAPGSPREDAYGIVQRAAAAAWDDGVPFRTSIEADPEVTSRLDADALAALFDPDRFLANLGPLFDRLEKLPVER